MWRRHFLPAKGRLNKRVAEASACATPCNARPSLDTISMNTPVKLEKETLMPSRKKPDGSAKVSRPIRVTLPISVAYDLDKFQRALANVAQMIGCTGCISGVDVTFPHAREFVVDPVSLQVREAAAAR
jgi:hypothetical protein